MPMIQVMRPPASGWSQRGTARAFRAFIAKRERAALKKDADQSGESSRDRHEQIAAPGRLVDCGQQKRGLRANECVHHERADHGGQEDRA